MKRRSFLAMMGLAPLISVLAMKASTDSASAGVSLGNEPFPVGAVNTAHPAVGLVTPNQIAASAITADKIVAGSILPSEIILPLY